MKINFDLSNIKNYRTIVGVLVVVIVILIVLITLTVTSNDNAQPDWIENKSQNPDEIEDVRLAMPYTDVDFAIFYSEEDDLFSVEYPGYKDEEEIEAKVITWFKNNANGVTQIKIKYGGIAGDIKSYDLNKDLETLLASNEYYQNYMTENYSNME